MELFRYSFVNSLLEAGQFMMPHLTILSPFGDAGGDRRGFNG